VVYTSDVDDEGRCCFCDERMTFTDPAEAVRWLQSDDDVPPEPVRDEAAEAMEQLA